MSGPIHDDPHVMAPGHAPTPFTADEIRAGNPPGRTIRLIVEVAGDPTYLRQTRFTAGDLEGSTQEMARIAADGEPLEAAEVVRSSWRDLQGHASFPLGVVTVEPDTIDSPLGRLDCLRYRVIDGSTVNTFWFARALPGMPAQYTEERDGQVLMSTTMIMNQLEP